MSALNATAQRDFVARCCGRTVRKGERCLVFRERALSYAHASAAGTMYPRVTACAECVAKRAEKRAAAAEGCGRAES